VHGADSDGEPSVAMAVEAKIDLNDTLPNQSTENGSVSVQQSINKNDPSNSVHSHGTPLSMGDILSSLDVGISVDKHSSKPKGTQQHAKHSNFWGRNSVSDEYYYFSSYSILLLIY
jgi:hypothetical protein